MEQNILKIQMMNSLFIKSELKNSVEKLSDSKITELIKTRKKELKKKK